MPNHRYTTEDDYNRERNQRRERERDPRDTRDVRGDTRGNRMEVDRGIRGDVRMGVDPLDRMNEPPNPRANTTARIDNRGNRTVRGQQEDDMMYDVRSGGYGQTRREASYEDDFSEIPAPVRPVVDPGPRPEKQPRPNYNEYFLPGDGIDREVIQSEICRFLGQDATCKPGLHTDGRRGYIIRGYRALTTEMIRSLKEDSAKYMREKERAAARNQRAVPYATIRDRMMMYEEDPMITDDPDRMDVRGDYQGNRQPQYEQYRNNNPNLRGGSTTSYIPESGLSAYQTVPAVPTQLQGYDPRFVPGSQVGPGNTTPPSSRTPGYTGSGGYTSTTRPPTSSAAPAYDARYDTVRGGQTMNMHSNPPEARRFR